MNAILEKSRLFALRIIRLYKYLCETKKEYILSKQILRCGTSIGANVTEAEAAVSKKDFLAKMHIAFKETAETRYWLDLLYQSNYLSAKEYASISKDCSELYRLLSAIKKTTAQASDK